MLLSPIRGDLGNRSLKVYEFGKHNYSFTANATNKGFTLLLKGWETENAAESGSLEEAVVSNRIKPENSTQLPLLTDDRGRARLAPLIFGQRYPELKWEPQE